LVKLTEALTIDSEKQLHVAYSVSRSSFFPQNYKKKNPTFMIPEGTDLKCSLLRCGWMCDVGGRCVAMKVLYSTTVSHKTLVFYIHNIFRPQGQLSGTPYKFL